MLTVMKTIYSVILIGVVLLLGVLILRPVPIPDEKDCLIVMGTVIEINEDGVKDVVFKLAGQDRTFYVNRGLERGLALEKLRAELMDKEITIKYPKYWTPLGNSSKHISKIESSGRTIFTEID
jgi:hypothetical protein